MQRSSDRRRLPPDLSQKAALWVLAGLVVASTVIRGLAAQKVASPWILPDELVYSELARSFAATGHFALRGVHTTAYSLGYPAILSVAFLGRGPAAAYEAAKWLNAALMSLAAVPVFFLARRLLPHSLALVAAAFALLLPSLAYTGVVMTENAFYPAYLVAILAIVRALERPTAGRQALALAAIGVAFVVRAQGIVLVPTLLLAIALLALASAGRDGTSAERWVEVRAELARYWLTAGLVAGGCLTALLVQAARGKSLTSLLGVYASAVRSYSPAAVLRWVAYHLVDLELYLGVLPFVPATIAAAALVWRRGSRRDERAMAAVSIAAVVCLVGLVATISSRPIAAASGLVATAVHDRYLFYVAPLYIVFFLVWLSRRQAMRSRALLPLVAASVLLPLVLPFRDVHTNADFEALALLPWRNTLIAERHVAVAMAVMVGVFSMLLFVRRSSFALLQVGLVGAVLFVTGQIAHEEISSASGQVASSFVHAPSWIDRAVPRGAKVVVLWQRDPRWSDGRALARAQALWKAEVFNESVRRVSFMGTPMAGDLPQSPAAAGRVSATGLGASYVLAASTLQIDATVVGRDPKAGLVLYRLRRGA